MPIRRHLWARIAIRSILGGTALIAWITWDRTLRHDSSSLETSNAGTNKIRVSDSSGGDDSVKGGRNSSPSNQASLLRCLRNFITGERKQLPLESLAGFKWHLARLDMRPKVRLSDQEAFAILEAIRWIDSHDERYRLRRDLARRRDYSTFKLDGGKALGSWDAFEPLDEVVYRYQLRMSDEASQLWSDYEYRYGEYRHDFSRNCYGPKMIAELFDNYERDRLQHELARREVSQRSLLAVEGHLRALRYELELIWLDDASIQRVVSELPAGVSERIDHDAMYSSLRPEEVRSGRIIPSHSTSRYAEPGGSLSYPDHVDTVSSTSAIADREFQDLKEWIDFGPDSRRWSEHIARVSAIREQHVKYEFPNVLRQSFLARQ